MRNNFEEYLANEYKIDETIIKLCAEAESEVSRVFAGIDETAQYNTLKVLRAMQKNRLSEAHLASTTGYGYNDIGRETLEAIYADVFGAELSLVRPQLISGTHALYVALSGNLRFGDELLSPAGKLYDTLEGVIGARKTKNSLAENGITYKQVDLKHDGGFDFDALEKAIGKNTKMAAIQRSRGYDTRRSYSVSEIKNLISFIKSVKPDIICMVDNCYGEFTGIIEPGNIGADLTVGSLIKNPGGGIAPTGGYIAGREEYVENAADRLTAPGIGREIGPGLGSIRHMLQGFFLAPNVVAGCLKGAVFASKVFEKLGYEISPRPEEERSDIVQAIRFKSKEELISFCEGIQYAAPVDSFAKAQGAPMPGYVHDVIMAAGAFIQGASIELSADAPLREPYTAYLQGGLSWHHAKIGIISGAGKLKKEGFIR
jgi:cystathionine beta-lyase family protein involved in aluminum resistance